VGARGAERARDESSVKGGRAASAWTGAELRAHLAEVPDESPREELRRLTRAMVRAMPAPSVPAATKGEGT
jgi:hypothetical protein